MFRWENSEMRSAKIKLILVDNLQVLKQYQAFLHFYGQKIGPKKAIDLILLSLNIANIGNFLQTKQKPLCFGQISKKLLEIKM